MTLLTKEQILAADDRRFETVEVPEWGGAIRLAEMSAKQREDFYSLFPKVAAGDSALSRCAYLVATCAVDESGAPLFSQEDVAALGKKNGVIVERLFRHCMDLNVLTEKAAEEQRGN